MIGTELGETVFKDTLSEALALRGKTEGSEASLLPDEHRGRVAPEKGEEGAGET